MLGASPDGAYVYFVANGDLDGAGPATAGNCDTSGNSGFTGACSIYLRHAGATSFVARLGANAAGDGVADYSNWLPYLQVLGSATMRTSLVAVDGDLLFSSTRSLTGYDSTAKFGPAREFFRYAPGDAGPVCVSCNPSGAAPLGGASLTSVEGDGLGYPLRNAPTIALQPRNLSADGSKVFFESPDHFVAADTNGVQDVYEWEAEGSGSCHSAAQNGGCLYLLSSGQSAAPSFLDDASASGDDVFIYTYDQLVPQDADGLQDLYDVRVDGGLASQHQVTQPPCAAADQCHGQGTTPPPTTGSGTGVFKGSGNPPPPSCRGGKVKRGNRCVARHPHKKHKKRHKAKKHHQRAHRRANSNRGGSK